MKLRIDIIEIHGNCPVYQIGDSFDLLDGYKLQIPESRTVCLHGLAALLPFYNALAKGIKPQKLGLAGSEPAAAFVQCADPWQHTGGGTVVFRITKSMA